MSEGGGGLRSLLGVEEFSAGLGKALVAEALGVFFINYFGCMSCLNVTSLTEPADLVLVSLAFGFVVMVSVQALGHVSGAHLNPAITCGFLAVGRVTIIRGLLYIVAQCIGAILGSAVVKAFTPVQVQGGLGHTTPALELTDAQGFGVEFFLGFLLVTVVFGVCDPNKPDAKIPAPLAIGLAVCVGHLSSIDYTGASMNPARTLGSAIVTNTWDHLWIYWVGPIIGGIAAALFYTYILAAPSVGEYAPVAAQNNDVSMKRVDSKHDDGQA